MSNDDLLFIIQELWNSGYRGNKRAERLGNELLNLLNSSETETAHHSDYELCSPSNPCHHCSICSTLMNSNERKENNL